MLSIKNNPELIFDLSIGKVPETTPIQKEKLNNNIFSILHLHFVISLFNLLCPVQFSSWRKVYIVVIENIKWSDGTLSC